MKILISIVTIILSYKIKIKTDKVFIETLIRTFNKIFNENHMTFNDYLDKIKINQNSIFSSINMIIVEKTIFILNAIF